MKKKDKYIFNKDGVYFSLTLEQIDDIAYTLGEIQRKERLARGMKAMIKGLNK